MDGQHASTDLGGSFLLSGCLALDGDQLQLVRLVGEFCPGLFVADLTAGKPLALLDDLAHSRLDCLEIIGGERLWHVEVVVEAVLDRRPDTQLGLGEDLLNRLRHDVRSRVTHDGAPLIRIGRDGLHDVAIA